MKHYLEFIAVKILAKIVILLPWKINYWLADRLGEISYIFLAKRRSLTIDNLTQAFKDEYDKKEIRRLAINTFRNFAKNIIEFISLSKINKDNVNNFVTINGLENLQKAKKKKKGVIILSSHLGNWELMAKALILKGYPITIMVRRQKNKLVEKVIEYQRSNSKIKTISHTLASKEIFNLLKNNEIIGMIADQDGGEKGIFINFFGRQASTIPSPVVFTIRSQAELIPLFDIRQKDNHHQIIIEPAYQLINTSNIKNDIINNTQRLTNKLESYIRQYPDQWLWLHNRWATKPNSSK